MTEKCALCRVKLPGAIRGVDAPAFLCPPCDTIVHAYQAEVSKDPRFQRALEESRRLDASEQSGNNSNT